MSIKLDRQQLAAIDSIAGAPDRPRACTERDFNLPVALHAGFFGLFLTYLGVMWAGFGNPNLLIPMAICIFFTAAFYVVPMLWTTMDGPNQTDAMGFDEMFARGVDIHTGRISGGGAAVQVLVLPVLILLWGVAVVVIAATA
jgi:hypothetical protein